MPNIDEDGSKKEKSRSVRERNLGWGVKGRERERERERLCFVKSINYVWVLWFSQYLQLCHSEL